MKQTKFSITIGIPVLNEENSIDVLVKSIFAQKNRYYKLEKIFIISDKSTDKTPSVIYSLQKKYKNLTFIEGKKRIGKCQRLNQIYKLNKSDILITFDGDIVLKNKNVLDEMIKPFFNSEVDLVAANDFPEETLNLSQKIMNAWYMLWYRIRIDYNNGDNLYNVHGDAQALRDSFAKTFHYPKGITADQDYLYINLKKSGKKFFHARRAYVTFFLPQTLQEYYFQTTRFLTEKDSIRKIVDLNDQNYYHIPTSHKVKKVLEQFLKHPIFTVLAAGVYLKLLVPNKNIDQENKKGLWTQIQSTKKSAHVSYLAV